MRLAVSKYQHTDLNQLGNYYAMCGVVGRHSSHKGEDDFGYDLLLVYEVHTSYVQLSHVHRI